MSRVPVHLIASDPISYAGIAGQLRHRPEVRLLDAAETTGAGAAGAPVVDAVAVVAVVATDTVDAETLRTLRGLRCAGTRHLVVIARHLDDGDLLALVEIGVAGLIRRADATADRLVAVIASAAAGEGAIPPDLLGRLLAQVGQVQRQVLGPRGLTFSGLNERETQVLKLVADGFDTAEIAAKLSYSQRTVKNVLHDITSRLHLRNRCHAVAYALRHGLI